MVAHGLASSLGGMHVVLGFAHVVMLTGDNQQSAGRIAREVADVTLNESDLFSLVRLRKLSMELIDRLDTSIRAIMLWNSGLLSLGIGGNHAADLVALAQRLHRRARRPRHEGLPARVRRGGFSCLLVIMRDVGL